MTVGGKISVVVVDDSSLVRQLLTEMLNSARDIEVVATAADPYMARDKIKQFNPDVITLDVEMPRMDGLTFLANLMRLRPMPVVMVSSLTEKGADTTLRALELGAIDFVSKPKIDVAGTLGNFTEEICDKVRTAARARVRARNASSLPLVADAPVVKPVQTTLRTTDRLIAIGASTGGTEAIRELLSAVPADMPGIVITQHIPAGFSTAFTRRMNTICAMAVCEPVDNQQILAGHVYIAPGDHHLLVERRGARYYCRIDDGPPVNRHRPSVGALFRSVAANVGPNAIGVILTGMGDDGARELKIMREAGAKTYAQDEASSVVWGMPGAAVALQAAQEILPLNRIARALESAVHEVGASMKTAAGH